MKNRGRWTAGWFVGWRQLGYLSKWGDFSSGSLNRLQPRARSTPHRQETGPRRDNCNTSNLSFLQNSINRLNLQNKILISINWAFCHNSYFGVLVSSLPMLNSWLFNHHYFCLWCNPSFSDNICTPHVCGVVFFPPLHCYLYFMLCLQQLSQPWMSGFVWRNSPFLRLFGCNTIFCLYILRIERIVSH